MVFQERSKLEMMLLNVSACSRSEAGVSAGSSLSCKSSAWLAIPRASCLFAPKEEQWDANLKGCINGNEQQ